MDAIRTFFVFAGILTGTLAVSAQSADSPAPAAAPASQPAVIAPADPASNADTVAQLADKIERMLDQAEQGDNGSADAQASEDKASAKVKAAKVSPANPPKATKATADADHHAGAAAADAPVIRFQFDGIAYNDVIQRFAQAAGRPLIGADQIIPGTLTFFDAQPYTYDQALDTLNLLLSMRGYVLLETGRFLRLVKAGEVQKMPLRLLRGSEKPAPPLRPGELVTVVLPMNMIDADEAAKAVQPMVSADYGSVSALPNGKSIVITDRSANIDRIRKLLAMIDTPTGQAVEHLWTYQVQHGQAVEIVKTIKALYGSPVNSPPVSKSSSKKEEDIRRERRLRAMRERAAQIQTRVRTGSSVATPLIITADVHSNRILLVADDPTIQLIESLIQQLDVPQTRTSVEIRLMTLKKTRAVQMAQTLQPTVSMMEKQSDVDIVVSAFDPTNQLLIAAPADQVDAIEQTIRKLDEQVQSSVSLQIFQLQHAKAADLVPVIQSTLGTPRSRSSHYSSYDYRSRHGLPASSSPGQLQVTADERLNALVVRGSHSEMQAVGDLVAMLDVPTEQKFEPIHLIRLETGDAPTLARTLTTMLGDDVKDVLIRADATSNTVLIRAPQAKRALLEKTLKDLDQKSDKQEREVRLIQLKHAKAAELVPVIQSTMGAPTARSSHYSSYDYRSRYGLPSSRTTDKPAVQVTADSRLNALVVRGSRSEIQAVGDLVAMLDVPTEQKFEPIHLIRLETGDAPTLAQTLTTMLGDDAKGVAIQADATSNTVLIRAPQAKRDLLEKTLKELDKKADRDEREIHIIQLKHTKAAQVVALLNQFFASETARSSPSYYPDWRSRYAATSRSTRKTDQPPRIAAAPGDQQIIVEGTVQQIARIEQMLVGIDQPATGKQRQVRTYQLSRSRADELAKSLTALFGGETDRYGHPTDDDSPRFQADAATNQLIVSASVEQFERIEKTINELERQAVIATKTRTYRLKYAKATDVAEVLRSVFGLSSQAKSSRSRRSYYRPWEYRSDWGSSEDEYGRSSPEKSHATIRVAALAQTNDLVVQGSEDALALADQLIQSFDQPGGSVNATIRIVRLKNAQADSLAEAMTRVLAKRQRSRAGASSSNANTASPIDMTVTVTAERNSNSVLVRGPSDKVDQVVEMISRLDEQATSNDMQVRIYRLKNANAEDMADNLNAIFAGLPRSSQTSRSSRYRRSRMSSQSASPHPTVTADTRTNALIVSATPAYFTLVEQLINELDTAPDKSTHDVTYIALENADAFDLSTQLNAMFADRKGDDKPIIQADYFTNALSVIAKTEDLAEIQQLVAKLDSAASDNSRTVRVITVGQMRADKVARMIQSLYPRIADTPVEVESSDATGPADQSPASQPPAGKTSSTQHDKQSTGKTSSKQSDKQSTGKTSSTQHDKQSTGKSSGKHSVKPSVESPASASVASSSAADLADPVAPAALDQRCDVDGAANPPVTIGVDRNANALIVTATRQQLDEIDALILKLQLSAASEEQEIRVYKIASGDPQSVATMLGKLFNTRQVVQSRAPARGAPAAGKNGKAAGGKRPAGRAQQPAPRVQVVQNISAVAEPRTSSVVVRARPAQLDLIDQLIKQIDVVSNTINEVRIFPLKNTDATEVADNLQQILAAGRSGPATGRNRSPASLRAQTIGQQMKVRIGKTLSQINAGDSIRVTSNTRTNALVVSAPVEILPLIGQLIEELDQSAALAQAPSIRLYPVRHADVTATVTALREIFRSAAAPARRGRSTRGRPASGGSDDIRITADQTGRVIIVSAPADQQNLIASVITDLDNAQATGQAAVRVYRLQYTSADEMARALAGTFPGAQGKQAAVRISADRSANALVVRGSADDHQRIAELIGEMDSSPAMKLPVQLIALDNADPQATADLLTRAFGDLQEVSQRRSRGRRSTRPTGGAGSAVLIEADPESRMLMVRAEPQVFKQIQQMAQQLDQATESSGSAVYIIALEKSDAANVASMITSLYQQEIAASRSSRRKVEPLAVTADARANALILATSKPMYEKVSGWVQQIETMKPARGVSRLITLEYADPAEVQQAINQLFSPSPSAGSPSRPTGRSRGRTSRSRPGAAAPTGSTGRVDTTVLPQQRAILINASEEDFKDIDALVKLLDTKAEQVKPLRRVVPLKNANNRRVAQALTQLYRQAGAKTARPGEQVVVTALQQSDALLVTAPKQRMDEVLELIKQLDNQQVSAKVDYRVFILQHVQPTKIIQPLQQLIRPLQQARPGEPITLQADERTRSIIVTARPGVFDQIEQIVKTLDTPAAFAAADILVYPLKKADATQLARVLSDMLKPSANNQVTAEARMLQEQVTRLRLHSKNGQSLPELDLTKPIKVVADPIQFRQQGSNALIVTSTPDNLKAMAAIIDMMDHAPLADEAVVKLVHLEHADGDSVMRILREVFQMGQQALSGNRNTSVAGRAEPTTLSGQALARPFTVSRDLRTNTLVLSGSKESVSLAELIIDDLDREQGRFVTEVRLFHLEHADAARLQPILAAVFAETTAAPGSEGVQTQVTRLRTRVKQYQSKESKLPKGRAALTVQADPASQMLIVAARSDVMPLIADVIETLDMPGAGPTNSVRIFPLVNADATRLRQVITDLYTGPNADAIRAEDKPTITVDTRTNVLVVAASDKTYATIRKLLKSLDAEQPIDFHDIHLIVLKNATADELAVSMQKLMDARVQRQQSLGTKDAEALKMTILADPRSNALLVSGSIEGYQLVRKLAEQLDGASPALGGQVQLFGLQHANAGNMATTLTNLFNQRYQAARTEDVRRQQPVILADLRTNSLMVSANADDTKVLTGLLAKLDRVLTDPAVRLVVIPLEHNDAGVLAPTIKQIFDARLQSMTPEGQTPSPQDRVDVAADSLANALIISASQENLQMIHELLAKVDVEPPMETGVVRVYHLEHADAAQVSAVLRDLVSQGLYKPGKAAVADNPTLQAQEKVSITPDLRTNTMIISASRENFAVIEQIIRGLDSFRGQELGQIKAFALKHADAEATAATLQRLFDAKQQAEQSLGESTRALKSTVTADTRTNSLLVSADKETLEMVRSLLAKLDTDEATKVTEIRVFPLQHAKADELAQLLNDTLNEKPTPLNAENPNRQTLLQFISQQPGGSQLVTTAVQQAMLINPDPRSNALIVAAPVGNLPLLNKLIQALDNANPRVAEIRVFNLTNADATQMADVLRQLFRLQAQPGATEDKSIRYTLVNDGAIQAKAKPKGGDQASAILGSAEQDALNVTVDVRTNSLLVGGTKHYVGLVSEVIETLDASPAQERRTSLYRLRFAQATQVQTALRDFLDQERQRLEQALGQEGLGAASRLLEREVAIVAEENTNTLLLSASPRYFETIEQMIRKLDQPPPQVLIQAQLIQLNLDDDTDVGLEWQYTNGLGDAATASVGTDFGLAAAARQFGGFSVAVTGGDLSFFLRALRNRGHARILSQPQILAADNQTGTINVGQSIPLVTSSQVTENDRIINTITYRDVGINMSITPRISPDGMVSVAVVPEISSLSDSNIEVTSGVSAPILDQIRATTTVSVRDGQSILIGGLIRATESQRQKKVPLLGDIPMVGGLFRSTSTSLERREILIILTPRILRNVKDNDLMTQSEIKASKAYHDVIGQTLEQKLYEELKDSKKDEAQPDKTKPNATQTIDLEKKMKTAKETP